MKTTSLLLAGLALAFARALSAADTPAAPAKPDPAEGNWLGRFGDGNNSSLIGLKISRGRDGQLQSSIMIEQLNFSLFPLPGFKAAEGHYTTPGDLDLQLKEGRLVGTFGVSKRVLDLARVDELPADPPIPADLPRGPGPRWQARLGGQLYAPASAGDGFAYVGSTHGVFTALKLSDGSIAWVFPAGRPIFGGALLTRDAVFFACDNGYLFKLNRADGKELWRYDLGGERAGRILPDPNDQSVDGYDMTGPTPLEVDGVLYIGSGDGSFHAVNATNGTRLWRTQSKGQIRTTAAISGPNVIFSTLGGLIQAVDRSTGKEVWQVDAKQPVTSSPALIAGKLIIGSRNSLLYGLNPATGAIDWKLYFWGSFVESTATDGGNGLAYIGSSDMRRITCFDPKDGRIVWKTDVFGSPWGRPVVTGKSIYDGTGAEVPYFTRHEGGVVALDRETGKLRWRWPLPNPPGTFSYGFAASPVLAGDLLLIGGLDGTLYAFPVQ